MSDGIIAQERVTGRGQGPLFAALPIVTAPMVAVFLVALFRRAAQAGAWVEVGVGFCNRTP